MQYHAGHLLIWRERQHLHLGGIILKKHKQQLQQPFSTVPKRHIAWGKYLFMAFMVICMLSLFSMAVFAEEATPNMWDKAQSIMQDVYNKILGISTIAGIVTAAVALLMMNFSKNGRTVDESRAWLKRIVITWVILNGLGFIMAYVVPLFEGGQWNG